MQQPVSGMHVAHGLMRGVAKILDRRGGLNRKSHAISSSKFSKRETLYGTKNEDQKLEV